MTACLPACHVLKEQTPGVLQVSLLCRTSGVRAQVSYCQGMAFVAGVILMYLPEEPAFSVLTRLMGPGGPDLRTLFLPGAHAHAPSFYR